MYLFKKSYLLKFFSFLCLSALILQIANKSINNHCHKLESNTLVTQAPPVNKKQDKTPSKSHNSNCLECFVCDALTTFIGTTTFCFSKTSEVVIIQKNYSYINLGLIKKFIKHKQNKSPPVLLNKHI